jgi:hypothetical protein
MSTVLVCTSEVKDIRAMHVWYGQKESVPPKIGCRCVGFGGREGPRFISQPHQPDQTIWSLPAHQTDHLRVSSQRKM